MKEEFDKNLKSPRGKSGVEFWSQAITKETARRRPDPKEDIVSFMWLWVGTGGEGTGRDTNQKADSVQCRWHCPEPTVRFFAV